MDLIDSPVYFESPAAFRAWLEQNHDKTTELLVGFYKVGSRRASMSWSESVDQALCFGWIDGVRRSIDQHRYCIRFTPRKPKSTWSAVNIKKIEALSQKQLMTPAGLAAFAKRSERNSRIYAYEQEEVKLSPDYEEIFRSNKKAWGFFQSLPPSYRKPAIYWVMSAKQAATRSRRLQELVSDSEAHRKIKQLRN